MKIQEAYNVWANIYDTNANKTRDLDESITWEILREKSFSKVIELGCGTGKNTLHLLKKADEIIALDFSEEMLRKAKEKIKDKRVVFKQSDITKSWDIENNFADLITANLVFEHISNLAAVFRQSYEKLQPNGLFFISEYHPFKQYLGKKARFETEKGTQELDTFTHHISEFLEVAHKNNFKLIALNEHFDKENTNEIPRLISFVFQKK